MEVVTINDNKWKPESSGETQEEIERRLTETLERKFSGYVRSGKGNWKLQYAPDGSTLTRAILEGGNSGNNVIPNSAAWGAVDTTNLRLSGVYISGKYDVRITLGVVAGANNTALDVSVARDGNTDPSDTGGTRLIYLNPNPAGVSSVESKYASITLEAGTIPEGTHTFDIVARCGGGTATIYDGGATNHARMVIEELPGGSNVVTEVLTNETNMPALFSGTNAWLDGTTWADDVVGRTFVTRMIWPGQVHTCSHLWMIIASGRAQCIGHDAPIESMWNVNANPVIAGTWTSLDTVNTYQGWLSMPNGMTECLGQVGAATQQFRDYAGAGRGDMEIGAFELSTSTKTPVAKINTYGTSYTGHAIYSMRQKMDTFTGLTGGGTQLRVYVQISWHSAGYNAIANSPRLIWLPIEGRY